MKIVKTVSVAIPSWFRSLASTVSTKMYAEGEACRNPFVVQVFGFLEGGACLGFSAEPSQSLRGSGLWLRRRLP